MSVESRIGQGIGIGARSKAEPETPKPLDQTTKPLRIPLVSYGIEQWSETIGSSTELDYVPGFIEQYTESLKEGYFPVVVGGPHNSQANGIELIPAADFLRNLSNEVLPPEKQIEGFLLPLSKALATGKQGKWPKIFYDSTKNALARHFIRPSLTATENDMKLRGVPANTREFAEDMAMGMQEGYGIMVLPEGSVKAGRKDENGNRYGMQPFVDISLKACIVLAKMHRRQNVVFIPAGIEGGIELHDPESKLPHRRALLAGFGIGDAKIGKLHIGLPIKSDTPELAAMIRNHNWLGVNDYVENRVADLVPQEMRGPYGTRKS
jgi:hypothetical protein